MEMAELPTIVNYGAGTNSTALLVGLHERGVLPDAVVFADTGGERPETYNYLSIMSEWLTSRGGPSVTVVKWVRKRAPYTGQFLSLERVSLMRKELPSVAYGFKGCSTKWKAQPVDAWVAANYGKNVRRLLGIDAGESHRAKESTVWQFEYPLIEWDWAREECIEAIDRVGLPRPGKSSCFFCPNMKTQEVRKLAVEHPELFARALALEENAVSKPGSTIRGLGRRRRWADIQDVAADDDFSPPAPCGCYDGD